MSSNQEAQRSIDSNPSLEEAASVNVSAQAIRLDGMPLEAAARSAPADNTDWALIERCRRNDPLAFEALVRRYQHKIHNYIARMVHNPEDSEDLTQETFVKAYLSVSNFRGESNVHTWLYRIATNLCIDRSRKKKRQPAQAFSLDEPTEEEDGDQMAREIADHLSDPYHELERRELQKRVREALQSLSEKLRAVVVLYDVQGLSYDEIAGVLNCPIGTVKSRLFHARLELGKKLQAYVQS